EDFEEYTDYLKALAKYEVNEERKQLNLKAEEEQIIKEAEEKLKTYRSRVEEAKKRYGEKKWDSLAKVELPLSMYMQKVIISSEVGPDVLFYLYHNLDENKRINSLATEQQIVALTELRFKIKDKVGKNKTDNKDKITK